MTPIFTLLLGFALLFLGGELLVKGAVGLALKFRVSVLVIGMTVVSFATSAPELFVSFHAVLRKSNDIAFGNIIGSNIANIALVLGFTALIFRINISKETLYFNYPFLLFSSLLFGVVLYCFNGVPSVIGVLFVIILLVFLYFIIKRSRADNLKTETGEEELTNLSSKKSLLYILSYLLSGIFLLKFGADYLVDGAISIAQKLNISERVIGVTVVAIGTSIPELVTSIIAAFRKEDNLAVGNLIGSNIFNLLAVLGIVASFNNITIIDTAILSFDYVWMMVITIVLGLVIYSFSRNQMSRFEGLLLLVLYFAYFYNSF